MVQKSNGYEVGRVLLNPSGRESFELMRSVNLCGVLYPKLSGEPVLVMV